jgi:hypothetical protein
MSLMMRDRPGDPMAGHLARLLLLAEALSADGGSLRALSTVARHDFLLRYPVVLERVLEEQGVALVPELSPRAIERRAVEARMLRYKFGFWDHRYYSLVGRLVGMGLVELDRVDAPIEMRLSNRGARAAEQLSGHRWAILRGRARLLRVNLDVTGYRLGQLIEQAIAA